MPAGDLSPFFRGERLFGDDLLPEEIAAWFEDEREGYADLGSADRASYQYGYHALDRLHGFRHLPPRFGGSALALGGAYGDEIGPIADRFDEIVIVDPSRAFQVEQVRGVPVRYVEPHPAGTLPFADETFEPGDLPERPAPHSQRHRRGEGVLPLPAAGRLCAGPGAGILDG